MEEQEQDDDHHSRRASSSRRTRAQAAPDWTANENLTLVTEVTAVEGEFHRTVSSFQKWKTVAKNCNALGVDRTLDQCRRQWNSLLSLYKNIKAWELSSRNGVGSYWSLENERRRELGFPEEEEFDFEVFMAIDDHLMAEGERSDTDPDNDPEAMADGDGDGDGIDVVLADSGFKRQMHHTMHQKHGIEEMLKPQKPGIDKKRVPEQSSAEKKPKPKHKKCRREEKVMLENDGIEEKEQMMFAKLRHNAELLTSILNGNLDESADFVLADLKNVEASQTAFTRRQGDKVITCLGNLTDTLDQLCDLVQGCG